MSPPQPGRPVHLATALTRLIALGRPYRLRLAGAVVLTVMAAGISLVVPLGLRELLDVVFSGGSRSTLNRLALGLFLLFLLQAVVYFAGNLLLAVTGERIVADFRRRIYEHLQRLSVRFFGDQKTGSLTSRLTSDVATIRVAVTDALVELITVTLKLVGSAAILLYLNWRVALFILVLLPAAAMISRHYGARLRMLSTRAQDALAESTAVATEALANHRMVLSFARGPHEVERYGRSIEQVYAVGRSRARATAMFSTVVMLLFFSGTAGIFWYGGLEVLAGRLSAGDLVAILFYAQNLTQGVGTVSSIYAVFSGAAGASERLFELLDVHPDVSDVPGAPALRRPRGDVRLENVSFAYTPEAPVLCGVDLDIRAGETVALVGPSGAGKTTLLHLLARFYDPTGGRILIDGRDIRSVQSLSLREQIALVSQEVQLFNDSVLENIRYGRLDASDDEVRAAARAAHAHEFITALPRGYATIVGERGVKLSGGQKQRISIARALLKDAPILLLDEATSSLDAESEALVKDALDRLIEDRTALIVAHRLATIRDADRIIVLDNGWVVDEGTHDELSRRQGLYSRLATKQFLYEPLHHVEVPAAAGLGRTADHLRVP